MTQLTDLSASGALDRLAAWQIALRAENKSPDTVSRSTPTAPPATCAGAPTTATCR